MRNRHRSPCYRELSGCRRDSTPNRRSVAWCAASIWSAPDGPGLLTLGASSVQTDPDRSRRIVWMINRMIKRLGRCLAIEAPRRLRAQYSESGGRSTRGHESHQSADAVPLDALTIQDVLTGPAMASGSVRRPGVSTAASSVGRRLATSDSDSQLVACGSVSRSTMTNGRVGRRITTVCHSTTNGPRLRAFRSSPATSLATSSRASS